MQAFLRRSWRLAGTAALAAAVGADAVVGRYGGDEFTVLLADDEHDAAVSAQVARSPHGQAVAYPVVRTVQTNGICTEVVGFGVEEAEAHSDRGQSGGPGSAGVEGRIANKGSAAPAAMLDHRMQRVRRRLERIGPREKGCALLLRQT